MTEKDKLKVDGAEWAKEPELADHLEISETTETLPVRLTDLDYKEFGIKMGLANQEIAQAEDELAAVKSQFKSRIDAAVAKRNEYASIINSGTVYKKVDCEVIKDFKQGTITVVRRDTFETVRSKTMTSEERQRGLKLVDPDA